MTIFTDPFGNQIGGGENLCGMLIEHQMIIAEMRSGNVPVKILCLEIKRKTVRQNSVQCFGYSLFCIVTRGHCLSPCELLPVNVIKIGRIGGILQ